MTDEQTEVGFVSASDALKAVLAGVRDDQFDALTPCKGWRVGDLLDHLMGLTVAFRVAAEKGPDPAPGGPGDPSVANLDPRWRDQLPGQLDDLVAAWSAPDAWRGEVTVAGATLPAEVMGLVALDELVVHGWDLARATGQPYEVSPQAVEAVHGLVSQQASSEGTPGLFGPSMELPPDAPLLDRVIGLTGRDPGWKP